MVQVTVKKPDYICFNLMHDMLETQQCCLIRAAMDWEDAEQMAKLLSLHYYLAAKVVDY